MCLGARAIEMPLREIIIVLSDRVPSVGPHVNKQQREGERATHKKDKKMEWRP